MRQAGRYMSEYRALREKHSLLHLCRTPELGHGDRGARKANPPPSSPSPLRGLERSRAGCEGWFAPIVAGEWQVALKRAPSEASRQSQLTVNGAGHSFP